MLVVIIALAIIAKIFAIRYVLLKEDLKLLNYDIKCSLEKEYKKSLFTNSSNKQVIELVDLLNEHLNEKKDSNIEYRKNNQKMKDSMDLLAHEMKASVNAISVYVDSMKSNMRSDNLEYVNLIGNESLSLKETVDALESFIQELDENYPSELEITPIDSLTRELILNYYYELDSQNNQLTLEIPNKRVETITDPHTLTKILSDLVSKIMSGGKEGYRLKVFNGEKNICNIELVSKHI